MVEQIKLFGVLPLKEISLRRVVTVVRSSTDVSAVVSKLTITEFVVKEVEWLQVHADFVIARKLSKLGLPVSLKSEAIDAVRPINLEVQRWKHFNKGCLRDVEKIDLPYLAKLCWTSAGLIDYRRTAKKFILCNSLDVVCRYRLACLNCLENDIPLLWEKLTEVDKKHFLRAGEPSPELTTCWPYIMSGELTELDYLLARQDRNFTSFNEWAFNKSALSGNKVATEYFLRKLTLKEMPYAIERATRDLIAFGFYTGSTAHYRNANLADVFCYLLRFFIPRGNRLIRHYPVSCLLKFFLCPCQDLFLWNAGFLWSFVPSSKYRYLARKMFSRHENLSYNTRKHLREFFLRSPPDFKEFLTEVNVAGLLVQHIFVVFMRLQDLGSIRVLFRCMNAVDRVKFVLHGNILNSFHSLIYQKKWHRVKIILEEVSLSMEDKKRMKVALEGILKWNGSGELENQHFKSCFEFLDGTDENKKAQKRKLEN